MTAKPRVLVAGATGSVGSRVVQRLVDRGHFVRALSRDPVRAQALAVSERVTLDATSPAEIDRALDGIDIVVSCLGANVSLRPRERRSYSALDPVANGNLLDAALRAGSKRFVYLGVHTAEGYDHTRYCLAHERFVERLRASPIASTVVRPTGIFTALDDLVAMAGFGVGSVIGDGTAKTNPIHPDDVADALVESLEEGPSDRPIGGPEVLTRNEILGLAFEARGRPLRALHLPPGLFRLHAALLAPIHPRLSELLEFATAVSTHDAVAERYGSRRLGDWFGALASRKALPPA